MKFDFFKHISNCLEYDRVGDGIVNEVSGLNNIIKVSSDDLIDNRLFIVRRKLKKTALIAVFLVPIYFLLYYFNSGPL